MLVIVVVCNAILLSIAIPWYFYKKRINLFSIRYEDWAIQDGRCESFFKEMSQTTRGWYKSWMVGTRHWCSHPNLLGWLSLTSVLTGVWLFQVGQTWGVPLTICWGVFGWWHSHWFQDCRVEPEEKKLDRKLEMQ